ncbi:hypothetical protein GCM10011491_40580 [Brucella endophytica]|uniref:Uncharacterized protein n=1 Tax=Brucella endophytica TaxID=1963359 RepID=A0A916SMY0_9HYPH|nr:hypothetical protein GCM10011491_40580 [Brucella endophytica]
MAHSQPTQEIALLIGTTILVVAADSAFRQSLGFVLEAEGHRVEVAGQLPHPDDIIRYGCIVADDRAVAAKPGDLPALSTLGRPVVLLVNHAEGTVVGHPVRLVEKPLLGRTLVEAVRGVLGESEP